MKKELTVYPAIFTKYNDNNEYYIVEFIDLKGCITEGATLQEAFYMARDAMGLYLDENCDFPEPTQEFSKIKLEKNQFISFVNIDMDEYRKSLIIKLLRKH